MLMRYHWGLAVGHAYTHLSKPVEDSEVQSSQSESTHDDSPDHRLSPEHHNGVATAVNPLNHRDPERDPEEIGGDDELWRHWDELVSDEDKSLHSDSESVILADAMYETDSDRDSRADEDLDLYEF